MSTEEFPAFEDLIPPIVLRANGKEYTLPVIEWERGVDLHRRITDGTMSEGQVMQELLGEDLAATLIADGAPAEFIDRVGAVAFADWKYGRETAKQVWADPKGVAQEILNRIQAVTATQTPEPTAPTTPTPASRTSTRSPKKAKTQASNGRKS
jgi:hypothetical protein